MVKTNKITKDDKISLTDVDTEQNPTDLDINNPINKLIEESQIHFEKANDEIKNGLLCLKKLQKIIIKLSTKKTKIKKTLNTKKPSGFGDNSIVPSELKNLLAIQEPMLPRTILTKKVYEYIETNKLKCANNKRILRVDDKLANALKLTREQINLINNSNDQKDKDGLNFYNIQTWISKLYPSHKDLKDKNETNNIINDLDLEQKVNIMANNIQVEDDLIIIKKSKLKSKN